MRCIIWQALNGGSPEEACDVKIVLNEKETEIVHKMH